MQYNNPYNQQQQEPQQPRDLFPSIWGSEEDFARGVSSCLARVFMRMFAALLVTAAVSFGIYSSEAAMQYVMDHPIMMIVLIVAQLILVMVLAFRVMKMSPAVSNVMFFTYAILTGITLSVIFISYEISTIFQAFAISALMFGAMAIYGTITKRDLTGIGTILRMALIGLIIASIVNIFVWSDTLRVIINYAGVLIFVGLTAYDTQRIKNMLAEANEANEEEAVKKISVMGALILYLDFINIFLKILAILGRRR